VREHLTWKSRIQNKNYPEALVRGTTEHAETHISGPDVRAAPVSAHGPDVSLRSALALKDSACWLRAGRTFSPGASHSRRPRASASAALARPHPCQQSACFLPCARPPDCVPPSRPKRSAASGNRTHRAFVPTCSGTDTMPRHSEGCIICRASRHLLWRATSFQRPIHTPS
jgi:hypothetical protein